MTEQQQEHMLYTSNSQQWRGRDWWVILVIINMLVYSMTVNMRELERECKPPEKI